MKICARILIIASMLFCFSCESWLDIQQEGEVTSEQLFTSGAGYRTALNGLYKAMGKPELYGRELSFGFVDCISQQYDLSNSGAFNKESEPAYMAATRFDYKDNFIVDMIDGIWLSGFNVIANANDILQNIRNASADLFEEGEMERRMIMGEAYACRALMHFDLLRLFAPAPVNDDGATYVPYVEDYPNIYASSIAVKPYLDKVITDLLKAREYVADYDTTTSGKQASSTGISRMKNAFQLSGGFAYSDFFAGRGYRLSYYSITALLARVYQYAGKDKEAYDCAKAVVDFGKAAGRLFYKDDFTGMIVTTGGEVEDFDRKTDNKVKENLIFAAYNEKAYTSSKIDRFFKLTEKIDGNPVPNIYLVVKQVEFFKNRGQDEWNTDIRSKCMLFPVLGQFPISGKWFVNTSKPENSEHLRISPVIRLTEMRYIMAEYLARQSKYQEAYDILNDIRKNRGITTGLTVRNTWMDFETDLISDARREWIAEGQLFYLYKRLDAAFDMNGESHKLSRGEASLPLPSDQI